METISRINPLWQVGSLTKTSDLPSVSENQKGIPVFSDILNSAIGNVKQTDNEYRQAEYLLATGQLDNPAVLGVAGAKAEISVQLLAQLRNKALESYNTISNMPV